MNFHVNVFVDGIFVRTIDQPQAAGCYYLLSHVSAMNKQTAMEVQWPFT